MQRFDAIVIGGGLVGAAIAYGLARRAEAGADRRGRRRLSRLARQFRPGLGAVARGSARRITSAGPGVLGRGMAGARRRARRPHRHRCRAAAARRRAPLPRRRGAREAPRPHGADARRGRQFRLRLPHARPRRARGRCCRASGPAVVGASWTPYDGHANSLPCCTRCTGLRRARAAPTCPTARSIDAAAAPQRFPPRQRRPTTIARAQGRARRRARQRQAGAAVRAERAGASRSAARSWSPSAPAASAPMPPTTVRQTHEGSIMLGDSMEDVGFDTAPAARGHAGDRRARRALLPLARRVADRARLGGAAGHAAGRPADLRRDPSDSPAPSPPIATAA